MRSGIRRQPHPHATAHSLGSGCLSFGGIHYNAGRLPILWQAVFYRPQPGSHRLNILIFGEAEGHWKDRTMVARDDHGEEPHLQGMVSASQSLMSQFQAAGALELLGPSAARVCGALMATKHHLPDSNLSRA